MFFKTQTLSGSIFFITRFSCFTNSLYKVRTNHRALGIYKNDNYTNAIKSIQITGKISLMKLTSKQDRQKNPRSQKDRRIVLLKD